MQIRRNLYCRNEMPVLIMVPCQSLAAIPVGANHYLLTEHPYWSVANQGGAACRAAMGTPSLGKQRHEKLVAICKNIFYIWFCAKDAINHTLVLLQIMT